MKKFEHKNKDERRRVLLSKNNELSYSFDNKELPEGNEAVQTNGLGVMAKLGALTRKQLQAFIAVIVALAVVVPALFVGMHVAGAEDIKQLSNSTTTVNRYLADQIGYDVPELVMNKDVTALNDDGSYHVKLSAYATADHLTPPKTDIALLLDVSERMDSSLYERDEVNLMNNTDFGSVSTSSLKHEKMYDSDNALNTERSIFHSSDGTYGDNKYILDPTNSMNYVYVAQTFKKINTPSPETLLGHPTGKYKWSRSYRYIYSFTDSTGTTWMTKPTETSLNTTGIDIPIIRTDTDSEAELENKLKGLGASILETFSNTISSLVSGNLPSELKFYKVTNPEDDFNEWSIDTSLFVKRDKIYYRRQQSILGVTYSRDESSTDDTLYHHLYNSSDNPTGKTLWIKDDTGELREVTIEKNTDSSGKVGTYTYTVHNANVIQDDGTIIQKDLTTVIGNTVYGAQVGVFQGFKTYELANGQVLMQYNLPVVDHENSLESKKLYLKDGTLENVTKLQAMKESVEQFLIQIHRSAYENYINYSGDSKFHVAVVTTSDKTMVPYYITISDNTTSASKSVEMADDIQVMDMIDALYEYSTDDNKQTLPIDSKWDFMVYEGMKEVQTQLTAHSGCERKFGVVFSSGMPTYTGLGSNPLTIGVERTTRMHNGRTLEERWTNWSKTMFCTTEANYAINVAHDLKQMGASIYTVGLYNYADSAEDKTYGSEYSYADSPLGLLSYPDISCEGNVGESWGSSLANRLTSDPNELTEIDAAATNRFMNYLSSNYEDSKNLGITRSALMNPGLWDYGILNYLGASTGTGYKITNKYARSDDQYYFAVSTKSSEEGTSEASDVGQQLAQAFKTIGEKAQTPDTTLGEDAQFYDAVTAYFNIKPDTLNASIVEASLDSSTGALIEGETVKQIVENGTVLDNDHYQNDDERITLTGLAYTTYHINSNDPRAMVLEFDLEPINGFIGGNHVPTNEGNSGIYDAPHRMEERFRVPSVDVPLNGNVLTQDQCVYAGDTIKLQNFISPDTIDGTNNAFVNIECKIYTKDSNGTEVLYNTFNVSSGDSIGSWDYDDSDRNKALLNYPALYESTDYRIEYSIAPTYTAGTQSAIHNQQRTAIAYVYQPKVQVKDGEVRYGTEVDLDPTADQQLPDDWNHFVGWYCDRPNCTLQPEGDAPTLTYTIQNLDTQETLTISGDDAYEMLENTNFQIIGVKRDGYQYAYVWIENTGTDEEPNFEAHNETIDVKDGGEFNEGTTTPAWINLVTHSAVAFENTTDSSKTNGEFLITVFKTFDLDIKKVFDGDYANAEDVTITVYEQGSTDPVANGSVTFHYDDDPNQSDFDGLVSKTAKTICDLDARKTYVVKETYANSDSVDDYATTYVLTTDAAGEHAMSGTTEADEELTFSGNVDYEKLYLKVNNHWDREIVVTGVSEDTHSTHILIIALAASAALSAGGYGVYRVYRLRKE